MDWSHEMKLLLPNGRVLLAAFGIPELGHAGIIWDFNSHEYELVDDEGRLDGADTAATA